MSSRRRLALLISLPLLALLLAWRRLLLQGLIPVDGGLMTVAYPNWSLLRAMASEPGWALWNPLRAMGFPHLADPLTGTLYPLSWLLALPSGFDGYLHGWVVAHTLLAAGGAAALAWSWHRLPAAAAAAALAAGLNGFFLGRVTMPQHFASAAWLPLAWYCLEARAPLALGACLALQWLAGYPPFFLLTGLLLAVMALRAGRTALRTLAQAAAWALGLAAIQLLPFLQLLTHSALRLTPELAAQSPLPPAQLLKELFLPQWAFWSPGLAGDPAVAGFYLGTAGLSLAAWGAWRGGARERWLAALAAAALALSLAGPLPGLRLPADWLFLAAALAAPLSAAGVRALPREPWRWAAAAFLAADLLLFAQAPRTAWSSPKFLTEPTPLDLLASHAPFPRVHHGERLMQAWAAGRLESEEDYLLMKDFLAPSYGMAFRVGEVSGHQVLRLKTAEEVRRRLAAAPEGSALLAWTGAALSVDLAPGSTRAERRALFVRSNPAARPRLFSPDAEMALSSFDYRPGRLRAEVDFRQGGLLVLSELVYPGWQARLDGERVFIESFADAFLSVRVPPGRHEILFRFRSWPFFLGLASTLAALLLGAGCAYRNSTMRNSSRGSALSE